MPGDTLTLTLTPAGVAQLAKGEAVPLATNDPRFPWVQLRAAADPNVPRDGQDG